MRNRFTGLGLAIAALSLSLSFAMSVAACGGGGGGSGPVFEGTLEVANDAFSTDRIDRIDVDEIGGPDHFSFDVFLMPGEAFDIDLFPDSYDVSIFWNSGDFEIHTVDVFDGLTTVLTVSN